MSARGCRACTGLKAGKITAEMARTADFRFPRGRRWWRWVARVRSTVILVHETTASRRQITVRPERRLIAQCRLPLEQAQ